MKKLLSSLATGLVAFGIKAGYAHSAFALNSLDSLEVPQRGYARDLGTYIGALLSLVLVLAALLVFFQLIYGGMQWIVSGGDKGKTEQARSRIMSAIIGIIILAASYAILLLVLNFLGFNSLEDLLNSVRRL